MKFQKKLCAASVGKRNTKMVNHRDEGTKLFETFTVANYLDDPVVDNIFLVEDSVHLATISAQTRKRIPRNHDH